MFDWRQGLARLSGAVLGGFLCCYSASAVERVHFSDFDDAAKVSDAWSNTQTAVPLGDRRSGRFSRNNPGGVAKAQRRFLGEFTSDTVTLSVKALPKHDFLRISFDLLILRTWNESQGLFDAGEGVILPECWGLQMEDGPLLLHGAFANHQLGAVKRQTFPTLIPGERVSAKSGSAAKLNNTLGYRDGNDTTYSISLLIPHSATRAKLHFFGENLTDPEEASWGLDNVLVETLRAEEVPELSDVAMQETWSDLGDPDPIKGYDAAWKLIASPEKALTRAETFLTNSAREDWRDQLMVRVRALIAQLDANEFRVRERATKELDRLGAAAIPLLRRAYRETNSSEVHTRLEALLSQGETELNPARLDDDGRRRERLGVVLGVINTAPAQKMIQHHYADR